MTTGWNSLLSLVDHEDREDELNNLKEACSIYFGVNSLWENFSALKKKKKKKWKISADAASFPLDS